MDVRCVRCREPWDMDSLHEEAEARSAADENRRAYEDYYAEVRADFQRRGCKALETAFGVQSCGPSDTGASETVALVYELMGDDMDGAAAMLEDAEAYGMLD